MDKMWKWPPRTHTDAGWDVDAGAASRECFSFMGRTVAGAEKGVPRDDVGVVSTLPVSQKIRIPDEARGAVVLGSSWGVGVS